MSFLLLDNGSLHFKVIFFIKFNMNLYKIYKIEKKTSLDIRQASLLMSKVQKIILFCGFWQTSFNSFYVLLLSQQSKHVPLFFQIKCYFIFRVVLTNLLICVHHLMLGALHFLLLFAYTRSYKGDVCMQWKNSTIWRTMDGVQR